MSDALSSSSTIEPGHGHLLRNIVLFGRLLRALEMDVTPTQILDLVAGLKHIDIGQRQDFKNTARTILVNQYEHIPLFNQAFDIFWQARESDALAEISLGELLAKPPETEGEEEVISRQTINDDSEGPQSDSEEPELETIYTYSAREILRQKDFTELTSNELTEVNRLMREMQWQLEQRRTRRKTRALPRHVSGSAPNDSPQPAVWRRTASTYLASAKIQASSAGAY